VFDENSFDFRLTIGGGHIAAGKILHTEVLIASATTKKEGMPIPLHCTWYNVVPSAIPGKDEFRLIEQVSGSCYQPSIEDIGNK